MGILHRNRQSSKSCLLVNRNADTITQKVNVLFPAHDHHIDWKTADYKVFNT